MVMVGFYLSKKEIITDRVNKGLSQMLMSVSMPLLVIYSFSSGISKEVLINAAGILVFSFVIHLVLILFCQPFYLKFAHHKKPVLHFSTIFANTVFMGFPVMHALFGSEGVLYASVFMIPMNVFMFSYGIMVFSGEKNPLKSLGKLYNAPLISTVLGITISLLGLKLPSPLMDTFHSIGNLTTPLSMFIIGKMVADIRFKDAFRGFEVYCVSMLRLLIIPVIIFFVLKLLHASETTIYTCVILEAMPTASLVGTFSETYEGDKLLASQCAFLTTLFSVFTIPVIVSIF